MHLNRMISGLLCLGSLSSAAWAAPATLTVDVNKPGAAISPTMHGIFFEDINYGADGGLYAELVQNRSFEHKEHLYSWSTVNRGGAGEVSVASTNPMNAANPNFVRIQARNAGQGFGVTNSGFGGIALRKGEKYVFTIEARRDAAYKGDLLVLLEDQNGKTISQTRLRGLDTKWKKHSAMLTANATSANARLVVLATGNGQVDLDMISLFPQNTWKKRPNGMRADLVKKLADMKPGFMRFPGGCIVEGRDLDNAYRWKETIGAVSERPQNWNRWMERNSPQYYQTYGLGFFEYFQLCEDIGAEPVAIINCGMACQYQTGELVPLNELGPWVQDALDLIEFANGPVTSTWGAKRAAMGHPKPFNLKYLGVGNEQWGEQYFERYNIFHKAIKAKYPNIQIVSTSGPGVDDHWWNLAWGKFKSGTPAEIVDEHYYRPPSWFYDQVNRYDSYDRNAPKVFAGEFAAHGEGTRSTLATALSEAAFMTGLVRNADVVKMASYAPLFAKEGSTQWTPDLIWLDNTKVFGTPSYYVQQLFGANRGDNVLPLDLKTEAPDPTKPGKIGVGTWNTQAEFKDIKVTKGSQTLFQSDFSKPLNGWTTARGQWQVLDGVLRQSGGGTDVRATVGDVKWSDYTLSLKARKTGGAEGFLILFQLPDDSATTWWNLGGWGNTAHGLEVPGVTAPRVNGTIETGRWYDVRVEVQGASVRCYLDGKLIHDVTRAPVKTLFAVASRQNSSGDVILKVVNSAPVANEAGIDLRGARRIAPKAKATILTSASPNDENSFQAPTKVAPRDTTVNVASPQFRHSFPANSVTVLRLKAS